jgi:hypothetical protein
LPYYKRRVATLIIIGNGHHGEEYTSDDLVDNLKCLLAAEGTRAICLTATAPAEMKIEDTRTTSYVVTVSRENRTI